MYTKNCVELKEVDEEAYKDLLNRNPVKWCKDFFETFSTCDSCENNMSEGFNGSLVEARGKLLIYMLEHLRMTMMTRLYKRKEWMSNHWDVICPRIRKRLEENMTECKVRMTTYNGDNKFQVDYMKWGFIVDIQKRTCTCMEWELTGIPCCHAIASLIKIRKRAEDFIAIVIRRMSF